MPRTQAQLAEHYAIEKELAKKLRAASREERGRLYTSLYNELFQRVPHHEQITQKASPELAAVHVARQIGFIRRFLNRSTAYLEIGPGDCALSLVVAQMVKQVYAIDVSDEVTQGPQFPSNFRLILSDGCSIPMPPDSVDVAYSYQLMEHLHPDDAVEQLHNVYRVLKPGGIYICITPNGINGPHDVSKGFDRVATGFHLKEYTLRELNALFRGVGFTAIRSYIEVGRTFRVPLFSLLAFERILRTLPYKPRMFVGKNLPLRLLLGRPLVAMK